MSDKEIIENKEISEKNNINKNEKNDDINKEEIKEKLENEINSKEKNEIKEKKEINEEEKENKNEIIEKENNDEKIKEDNKNEIIEKEENKKDNEININNNINNINKEKKEDILSKKFKEHNDDYKYLVKLDEDKELQNIINEHNNNSSDEDDDDEEEEETFPFRIIGDVQKKGETIGKFNHRYLEIDSVKGILKRYKSSKEYPRLPLEIIPIKTLKSLKKVAKDLNKDCYDFELVFTVTKGNKKEEKVQIYRVRHMESRNKWHDSLLALWKHLVKGEKIPKINSHKLQFVDDQAGIIQDIKQHNDRSKVKTGKVTLRNFKILGL